MELQEPVNPSSSAITRAVLRLLYELPNRPDRKVISGQVLRTLDQEPTGPYGAYTPYADVYDRIQMIRDQTGYWVGIAGAEYTDWARAYVSGDPDNQQIMSTELNPHLIAHSQRGGIVELHFHPMSPRTGREDDDQLSADDLLVNPGRIRNNWMRLLSDAAAGLEELRDNDVVVLWRPMHGVDLGWWWGSMAGGAADYRRVWAHMVDYFSNTRRLDNILYVQDWYGVPGGAGHFYVGGDLVDVVSLDTYPFPDGIGGPAEWDWLESTGKPIGVSESWADETAMGTFDMRTVIEAIRQLRPRITYFVQFDHPRYPNNHIAANLFGSELLSDPWIINAPIF